MNTTVIDLLGGTKYIKPKINNRIELLSLAKKGLSTKVLGAIQKNTNLSMKELTASLPISVATLSRQKKAPRFNSLISEKLISLAIFWARGLEIFEDNEKFLLWLHNPSIALGGITPISLIDSSIGIDILKNELGRIEHGVFA